MDSEKANFANGVATARLERIPEMCGKAIRRDFFFSLYLKTGDYKLKKTRLGKLLSSFVLMSLSLRLNGALELLFDSRMNKIRVKPRKQGK